MYISYNVLEVYMQCYRNTLKLIWHLPYHQSMLPTCSNAPPNLKEKPQLPWEEGEKGDQCRGNYMKKGPHLNAPNP